MVDIKDNRFPSPSPRDIRLAAEAMWKKPLDQATADAIGGDPKCVLALKQLLERYPVTAAMAFAVTFGYQLRVQVEKQGKTLLDA